MGFGDADEDYEEEIINQPEEKEDYFKSFSRTKNTEADGTVYPRSSKKSKVVNIHATTQLKVVVLQPTVYSDATEIAGHLKSKKPVVINLEKLDKETARKIVDFLSGAVYALDGSMQKVSNGILLAVPYTMGIMGDFSDELKTQGLFDFF